VELSNDVAFAIFDTPDERPRVSLLSEDVRWFESSVQVVNTELPRPVTSIIESEGDQARVDSNGQVGCVTVLTNDKAALTFTIYLFGVVQLVLRTSPDDPKLSTWRKLRVCGPTSTLRIEQRH
jgi:hypothetical protein